MPDFERFFSHSVTAGADEVHSTRPEKDGRDLVRTDHPLRKLQARAVCAMAAGLQNALWTGRQDLHASAQHHGAPVTWKEATMASRRPAMRDDDEHVAGYAIRVEARRDVPPRFDPCRRLVLGDRFWTKLIPLYRDRAPTCRWTRSSMTYVELAVCQIRLPRLEGRSRAGKAVRAHRRARVTIDFRPDDAGRTPQYYELTRAVTRSASPVGKFG